MEQPRLKNFSESKTMWIWVLYRYHSRIPFKRYDKFKKKKNLARSQRKKPQRKFLNCNSEHLDWAIFDIWVLIIDTLVLIFDLSSKLIQTANGIFKSNQIKSKCHPVSVTDLQYQIRNHTEIKWWREKK